MTGNPGVRSGQASFACIPSRAIGDRRLSGAHLHVLLAIALHDRRSVYNGGQKCWASIRTIARETNLAPRSVKRVIVDLIEWGYVLADRPRQNRRYLCISYEGGDSHVPTGGDSGVTQTRTLNQITLKQRSQDLLWITEAAARPEL